MSTMDKKKKIGPFLEMERDFHFDRYTRDSLIREERKRMAAATGIPEGLMVGRGVTEAKTSGRINIGDPVFFEEEPVERARDYYKSQYEEMRGMLRKQTQYMEDYSRHLRSIHAEFEHSRDRGRGYRSGPDVETRMMLSLFDNTRFMLEENQRLLHKMFGFMGQIPVNKAEPTVTSYTTSSEAEPVIKEYVDRVSKQGSEPEIITDAKKRISEAT